MLGTGGDSDSSSDYGDEEVVDFLDEIEEVEDDAEASALASTGGVISVAAQRSAASVALVENHSSEVAENGMQEAKEGAGFILDNDSLRQTTFFSQFQPEHQKTLFEKLIQVEFEAREDIVTEGMPGDCFYVIIEGEAQILKNERYMESDGERTGELRKAKSQAELKVLTHIYRGDSFGELCVFLYCIQKYRLY